ncbi:MAG: ribokinase [Fusobacteriaceae bacterium]|jgi:ribokinase|nr:rbsK [Fusobacteriales bacterium]MDN5303606.1 ribokinase [Fusobacteriaceae bacterium]
MKKILVLGSINMDLVTKVKITPNVGETVFGDGLVQIPGGKGANQAVAIGRLGGNIKMIGKIGKDEYGKKLIENLKKNNVDTKYITESQEKSTGIAFIMVNEDGDNSIVVIPGANYDIKPEDIKEEMFENIDYVLAQLEVPMETINKAFEIAKKKGIYTILNPAPAKVLDQKIIKNTDLIIPNETEFKTITGYRPNDIEIEKGINELFEKGINAILITLGKNGVKYIDKNKNEYKVKAYKVNAIDTTAAGDSFIGGFITALSEGKNLEDAIENGVKVAAITVTKFGAQSSLPTKNELLNFKGVK